MINFSKFHKSSVKAQESKYINYLANTCQSHSLQYYNQHMSTHPRGEGISLPKIGWQTHIQMSQWVMQHAPKRLNSFFGGGGRGGVWIFKFLMFTICSHHAFGAFPRCSSSFQDVLSSIIFYPINYITSQHKDFIAILFKFSTWQDILWAKCCSL